jgi:hypothetical protein
LYLASLNESLKNGGVTYSCSRSPLFSNLAQKSYNPPQTAQQTPPPIEVLEKINTPTIPQSHEIVVKLGQFFTQDRMFGVLNALSYLLENSDAYFRIQNINAPTPTKEKLAAQRTTLRKLTYGTLAGLAIGGCYLAYRLWKKK